MPQGPAHLHAKWGDCRNALGFLGGRFKCVDGLIRPLSGTIPTAEELEAIDYLFLEWDFGYDPEPGHDVAPIP